MKTLSGLAPKRSRRSESKSNRPVRAVWSRPCDQTATRRKKHPERTPFYDRLDRFTVGVGAGILPATVVLFLANKAIPMDVAGRGAWEETAFWLSWLAAVVVAMRIPSPAVSLKRLLLAGGAGALLLPVANGLATGGWLWTTPAQGLRTVFWFDLAALTAGATLLAIAVRLRPGATATATAEARDSASSLDAGEGLPAASAG